MKSFSILNHVLGPVMRGPSSSHTAGAYHLARMAGSLLGESPLRAIIAFDPTGSYARTYEAQGADRSFAMGLLNLPLTDKRFFRARETAAECGLKVNYETRTLRHAQHPNAVEILLTGQHGSTLQLEGQSIGGGEVEITRLGGWPIRFCGTSYELLIEVERSSVDAVKGFVSSLSGLLGTPSVEGCDTQAAVLVSLTERLTNPARSELVNQLGVRRIYESLPVYFPQSGQPLFDSAAAMVERAAERGVSLGRLALSYEAALLRIAEEEVTDAILRRYDIMTQSVAEGLADGVAGLSLLSASAGRVFRAEAEGRLSLSSSPATRAGARALAVMHVNGSMGVVCAAPTGGSAGTIPGALMTLAEERDLSREAIALALLAAGAVGVIVAQRATFAAETAGCQVEIGAAGAMASAAIIEALGGSAEAASNAAAIAFQNTMGNVCDLLHGRVEIPCHTRNAAAAAGAFTVADLVMGGYGNPIPLDDTIDAVYAVGKAMPSELRCTSRGGLAVTPAAQALMPRCCGNGCGG